MHAAKSVFDANSKTFYKVHIYDKVVNFVVVAVACLNSSKFHKTVAKAKPTWQKLDYYAMF